MRKILWAPALTGAAILAGSAIGAVVHLQFEHRALRAEGVVIEQVMERSAEGRQSTTFYYPVVTFNDAQGRPVRFRDALGNGGGPMYQTGSRVEVLYESDDPSQARIGNFAAAWLMPLGGAVLGSMILAVGLLAGERAGESA